MKSRVLTLIMSLGPGPQHVPKVASHDPPEPLVVGYHAGKELHCPCGPASATDLINAAQALVDYILGDNPMGLSYLVGFGTKYPSKVHHRGASLVSYKQSRVFVGCSQGYDDWYGQADTYKNMVVECANLYSTL